MILDECLVLLEESLERGQLRVDAALGLKLRKLLGQAGLIPDHRLEGRRVERVLDDIFALQDGAKGGRPPFPESPSRRIV